MLRGKWLLRNKTRPAHPHLAICLPAQLADAADQPLQLGVVPDVCLYMLRCLLQHNVHACMGACMATWEHALPHGNTHGSAWVAGRTGCCMGSHRLWVHHGDPFQPNQCVWHARHGGCMGRAWGLHNAWCHTLAPSAAAASRIIGASVAWPMGAGGVTVNAPPLGARRGLGGNVGGLERTRCTQRGDSTCTQQDPCYNYQMM